MVVVETVVVETVVVETVVVETVAVETAAVDTDVPLRREAAAIFGPALARYPNGGAVLATTRGWRAMVQSIRNASAGTYPCYPAFARSCAMYDLTRRGDPACENALRMVALCWKLLPCTRHRPVRRPSCLPRIASCSHPGTSRGCCQRRVRCAATRQTPSSAGFCGRTGALSPVKPYCGPKPCTTGPWRLRRPPRLRHPTARRGLLTSSQSSLASAHAASPAAPGLARLPERLCSNASSSTASRHP